MQIYKLVSTLFGAYLALFSSSAQGVNWPPVLDPDPEVQPPKWDWQISEAVLLNSDTSIEIYDIDMFDNENTDVIEMLHDKGYKAICYINVGAWEDWRDDKADFPAGIIGATYVGYPDENWLDIRDVNSAKSTTGTKLAKILEARFDRAMRMGCDAIEPDNMDSFTAETGFPLTYEDQIYFNLWLAKAVHERQMLIALKNDNSQAHDERIYNTFDFVISEECFQYNECDDFSDFLAANKPVFAAEYKLSLSEFCPKAKASRISAIKKRTSLNAVREDCSDYYDRQPPGDKVPTADFVSTCADLICTFTDKSVTSGNTIVSWLWNFVDDISNGNNLSDNTLSDNNSSTLQNPSHTYTSEGSYTVSLTVTDNEGGSSKVINQVIVGVGTPVEETFVSIPKEDGWIRESGKDSNVGGRRNTGGSGARAIRFGDDKRGRQYKSVLSFDTSSLPDGVTIVSATLQLTRGGTSGSNAYNTHGLAHIDIKKGSLGDNAALQNNDFEAEVDAEQVAVIKNQGGNGTTYNISLNADALAHINDDGRTQLRLYFSLGNNDDGGNDYVGFYSANNSNPAWHPKLILIYEQ